MNPRMAGMFFVLLTLCIFIYVMLYNSVAERSKFHHEFINITHLTKGEFKYQKCKVQVLDPYHADVLPYLSKRTPGRCGIKQYGKLHDGILQLKVKNVQIAWLYYIRRVDDFYFTYSKPYMVFGDNDNKTVNFGAECWKKCNQKTGSCPSFCGVGGYCCRKGYNGCPNNVITPKDHPIRNIIISKGHMCTIDIKSKDRTFPKQDIDIQYTLEEDYFKLNLLINGVIHEEFHAAFSKPRKPSKGPQPSHEQNKSKSDGIKHNNDNNTPNIMMVMIDAVSHANFQRSLKESYKYLTDDPDTYIFKGHSVVGDGTTAQLSAAFTGIPLHEQPEARTGKKGAKHVDRWTFIFNKMHQMGYKTLYSEDSWVGATFNYRLIGWKKIPTTKYPREWWMAAEPLLRKNSPVCGTTVQFDYLKRYWKSYNDYKKFAFVLLARVSHDNMNFLPSIDQDILGFYKYLHTTGYLNNTVVFTFADHGYRAGNFRSTLHGKLEERMPFMAITVPPSFNSHRTYMKSIKDNVNLLTSPFDTYATLQHILSWPHYDNKTNGKFGRSFFTNIKRLNRTCADAGIAPHWCACLDYEVVNVSKDKAVLMVVNHILNYINGLNEKDAKGKCSKLTLRKILRAGRRVRKFYKETKLKRYTYEVAFSVSPSGGEYEVTRDCTFNKYGGVDITMNRVISRTNFYRHQPDCVAKQHPNLRKYCYCKSLEKHS